MSVDREPQRIDLSVVVPVYGSAQMLGELFRRTAKVLDAAGLEWELVLVDDGSPDESWDVLVELHRERPERVVAVQLMRNFGQHNALMCGLRRARGEAVVTMDDDLQHPPEEIPKLLAALRDGRLDLVYATYERRRHGFLRNLGAGLLTAFYRWIFGVPIRFTAFRAMRRELAQSVLTYDLSFTFLDGLLAWNTRRIGGAQVRHDARSHGGSGYSPSRLLLLSLNMLTNFSLFPLQFVSLVGLLAATGGFIVGAYYLVMAIAGRLTVPGYASTIVAVLTLGGIQLLALGVIGEYLGRVHLNINRKPQFVERRVLGAASDAETE